ncbi:MAG: radical SAM protein [Dehalococcoidia bacterium]|nr:radical SAM protein [Dehalococcoidia bacterium]
MQNKPRDTGGQTQANDYVFRYPVGQGHDHTALYHNRLAELLRSTLESLLNTVVLQRDGRDIKIDGFRWLDVKSDSYRIFGDSVKNPPPVAVDHKDDPLPRTVENFQDPQNAVFYEPRIDLIKRLAESLLNLVDFETQGKPVMVDGFRLKDLEDWVVPSPADPAEVFEYAATRCSCDCVFCCNKGNPALLAAVQTPVRSSAEELREMETRLRFLSPQGKMALFPTSGTICDAMSHPYFLDILRKLRQKTDKPFRITTNGNMLTPEVVSALAQLKPVYIYISLNSSSPARRRMLMNDPQPETAIGSLQLLRRAGIPYAAVIVPWPVDTADKMLEDLAATVRYAAENGAHIIQVNLPGYSRYFSSKAPFDTGEIWLAIVRCVRTLRDACDTPIVVMPALYEENLYEPKKNLPLVTGIVQNSPACLAGVKMGDLLVEVGGIPVRDRPQARDLLAATNSSGMADVIIRVQRGGRILVLNLDTRHCSYPYSNAIDDYLGIVFRGAGLRSSCLERLKDIVETHRAERVLFLSSELMRPTFEQCLAESHLFDNVRIETDVPKNTFFGGNIIMGDLLVVQDFTDCIEGHLKRGERPDLVVIPSSPFNLSGWGRDLTGRVYLDIERHTGVSLELLPCDTIYS